ncbi:EAL domain-containing protein [Rhizobium sp. CNPSo 3968]|uniref:putative bifunctional diguanylate cyclase/phosphodiesterase n=1 Tax=Rhizobium sp. CNPSo 3968 TaxID=3021408 RepID=UPI000DE08D60|nr:EAL domain-containing protein [Rhizobium sp. CNPSo 3968]MDK4724205.1 EAL domain-containing protein [Rhizobium sp. CNPSo 3968]
MRSKLAWTKNELEDLLRQLDVALEASGIGIWQHNLRLNQTRWDEQLQRLYGVKKGELDVVWLDSVHPEDCPLASAIFEDAIANKSDYASQFRIIRPNGEIRHVRSRAKYFVDGKGEECFIGAEWDVTEDVLRNEQLAYERQAAEKSRAEAKFAAEHDHLTGLTNRRAFDEAFAKLATGAFDTAALCHIDIDRFKEINDRFGHAGGDAVLRHVGSILSGVVTGDEIAARLGGDEFAILSPQCDVQRAGTLLQLVRQGLSRPIDLGGGQPIKVELSAGIAHAQGPEIATLLASSDIALYAAKNDGRNRDEVFSPSLAEKLSEEKQLLQDLRNAVGLGEIVPYYQVQVEARTFSICGLEALARWESRNGLIMPAAFLPVAVANGLMASIDDAILHRVLFDIKRWELSGFNVPRVSVNLSAARLADPGLPDRLRSVAIPPGQISFELIETIFLDTLSSQVKENIELIRQLGIEIEIDDLGSGHASLIGLVELRPERVKIDRHLVNPVLGSKTQRRLISSLIDIARALEMTVVAEGVETMEHATILAELGADVLQGYAFGRPEAAALIAPRLSDQHSERVPPRVFANR